MKTLLLIIVLTIAVVAQTPTSTPVVYRLNPEASKAFLEVEGAMQAENRRHDAEMKRLAQLQLALLLGGERGVPPEARGNCLNEKEIVVCAIPAPSPAPSPVPSPTPEKK